jgi:hypothetical protein
MAGKTDLTRNLRRRPGASDQDLSSFAARTGIELPPDLAEFLRSSNGAEGPVGRAGYLRLWSLEEMLAAQSEAGVAEFAPGLFLIASDGGDGTFGLDTRSRPPPIVRVSLEELSLQNLTNVGLSLADLLTYLARLRW